MATDSVIPFFARVPLFAGLSQQRLEQIAACAERIVFQSRDVIQGEGDIPDAAILLISGKAVLMDDSDGEGIDFVTPGSLIGELAMLIETRAVSTVVAQSTVRAFRIPRFALRAAMERDPAVADHFVAKINERLAAMAENMRRVDRLVANSLTHLPTRPASRAMTPPPQDAHPIH